MAIDVTPPQNTAAEEAVLGSCLMDRGAIMESSMMVAPADFYREKNGSIFQAILDLYDQREPADNITLRHRLETQGLLDECGGSEYLSSLTSTALVPGNVQHYARIVKDMSTRRQMVKAGGDIAAMGYNQGRPVADELYEAQIKLNDLNRGDAKIVTMREAVNAMLADIKSRKASGEYGAKTGFPALDEAMRMAPGDLVVVAARPSQGKSAFALCVARRANLRGDGVAMCSIEMSRGQVIQRLVCMETGLDYKTVDDGGHTQEEADTIEAYAQVMMGRELYVDDHGLQNLSHVRQFATTCVAQYGVALVIVDYLSLIDMPGAADGDTNRVQAVSAVTRGLKLMAKDLGVPVMLLCQLNRKIEDRGIVDGLLPHFLSDLKESGSIEQDADKVIMIDQVTRYNAKKFPYLTLADRRQVMQARLFLAKNRNGAVLDVMLGFNGPTMEFV